MKRAILLAALLSACSEDVEAPSSIAQVLLTRAPDGVIDVELRGAPSTPRAVQLELTVESQVAHILEDAAPPLGASIDTVRIAMRGTNRAILFTGDKRGVRLSRDGPIARFRIRSSGSNAPARVFVESALAVAADGTEIPVEPGPSISVR